MTKYSNYINSLKRLFDNKEIEAAKIKNLLSKKMITNDEYNYIMKRGE